MVTPPAFSTRKAIMKDATVKEAVVHLSHIGPEKAISLCKMLVIVLFQWFEIVFNALVIL